MIAPWRLLAAAGALAVIAAGPVVAASPAAADTTLEVTTPADGHYLGGGMPIPLLVTIKADGAVKGTLVATFDGTFAGAQVVEVPGGSSKQVLFVVTPPQWSTSGQISFDGGPDDNASARLNLQPAGSDEMVGVLPSLTEGGRDLPATAQLAVDLGVARLYPFDPTLLDTAGPEALGAFSQVLATPDDLAALPDNQLSALRAWVGTTGGTLVVDGPPGTPIPLEAEPLPGAIDGSSTFGVGQVRFSDGKASASDYDGVFAPTIPRDTTEFPFGANAFGLAPTTILLASDAGVRIPAIGTLVGLLVVYGLVAGPVLWLVLRRTKRETILWLALPALAVVATGAVYGLGRAMRHDTSTAHATIVADLPATRVITTEVLVTAPGGGKAGVELGEGWRPVQSVSDEQFFGPGAFGIGGAGSTRKQSLDGNKLLTDLPAGGVGVVSAETAQPAAEPSWSFDLHPTDNGLAGTVTNQTDRTLETIMVSSGQGFDQVSDLAPGESAEVTLNGANRPVVTSDRMAEQLMNGDPFSPNDRAANPGLLANWLSRRPMLRSPGFVTAVGWTREQPGPLHTARGATVDKGRTAFLTTARVDTSDLDAASGRIELVRGTSTRVADRSGANECTDLTTTARITPADSVTQPVLAVSTRSVAALDIWTGDGWLPAGLDAAGGPDVALALPEGAGDNGSVYVRLQMTCDVWGVPDPFPSLRSAESGEELFAIDATSVVRAGLGTGGTTTTTSGVDASTTGLAVARPVPLPAVTVAPTTTVPGGGND